MSQSPSLNPYEPPHADIFSDERAAAVVYEPRRHVPWDGWDVLVVVAEFVLCEFVARRILEQFFPGAGAGEPAEPTAHLFQWQMLANSASTCAGLLCGVVTLKTRALASWSDLGMSLRHPLRDLKLGLKTFAIVAPVVFGLQFVLVQWFPSEHPLVKMVHDEPGRQTLWIATIAAVVIAPLVEEFLFRVVLQGWLESRESRWRRARYPLFRGLPRGAGPILLSSTLFALLHLGHGPDPIPLFVLAAALGYVYRLTHRIWPGMIVHMCLNGTSVGMLWLSPAGN